jgi:hypothetical protein
MEVKCGKRSGLHAWIEDVEHFTRDELIDVVKRLRAGIRQHRENTKPDLCWDHHQPRHRQSLDAQLRRAPRVNDKFGGQREGR